MDSKFPEIKREELTTLQVNLGYKCNQWCAHCHVNAGPNRKEMMRDETISIIPEILRIYKIKHLDLTGGAPELHPKFRELVVKARKSNVEIIDRCNLTIMSEPGYEDLAKFLASNKVTIVASLPCYEKDNVDKQRGSGVFDRSINALKELNSLGYGKEDSGLKLNLVYNPLGASLPPNQFLLEKEFKRKLKENYNIIFSNLYTITNMPIKRFATHLQCTGQLDTYMKLLKDSYNSTNLENVMCKNLISVNWEGYLYDCDFNQQLGKNIEGRLNSLEDLLEKKFDLMEMKIAVGDHCYGCTAGSGSSCGGALT